MHVVCCVVMLGRKAVSERECQSFGTRVGSLAVVLFSLSLYRYSSKKKFSKEKVGGI